MTAEFDRAFEDVIHRRRSAWHVIGGDRERLIQACIDWLTPERVGAHDFSNPAPGCATWILDRLLPLEEVDLFRRLNSYERWLYTLYPLFRRSPEDMSSVTPQRFVNGEDRAAEAAWVETRTNDDELLGWHSECQRRGWPTGTKHLNPLSVVEYCLRAPDLNRLVAYLGDAPRHEVPVILHCLMRLVAGSLPRTKTPERGLEGRLRKAGFEELAAMVAAKMKADPVRPESLLTAEIEKRDDDLWIRESSLAETLWVEQQTVDDIDRLLESRPMFAARRLGRVIPKDRADIWEHVFARARYDEELIRAFCEWCPPEQRELLVPQFGQGDIEWRACALERYLSLASAQEIKHLVDDERRPKWRADFLDRWMHAPADLRPPRRPVRGGPCEIVFDLRELDPFDVTRSGG